MKLNSRQTLTLIALLCILPVVASYLAFYVFPPEKTVNYGQLLPPTPVAQAKLSGPDGAPLELSALRGRWILVHANAAQCDEACRKQLYYMRQVRTALGKEMDRVERVWLLTDAGAPDATLLAEHPGLRVARAADSATLAQLAASASPGGPVNAHIYLIDPLGNLMMRFPPDLEPKRMLKDLERLLKVSRVG